MRKNLLLGLLPLVILAAACGGTGSGAAQQEQKTTFPARIIMANDCGIVNIGQEIWYASGCEGITPGLCALDKIPSIDVWSPG